MAVGPRTGQGEGEIAGEGVAVRAVVVERERLVRPDDTNTHDVGASHNVCFDRRGRVPHAAPDDGGADSRPHVLGR